MGERRFRDALAPVLVSALLAGGVGYALGGPGSPGEGARELPERRAPAAALLPATGSRGDELERLRSELATERALRTQLERELQELRVDAEELVAVYREESVGSEQLGTEQTAAPDAADATELARRRRLAAQPIPKGVSMEALLAAGFGPFQAERIREQIEGIAMRQLELQNHAQREGWAKTPRFAKAHRVIGSEFGEMREEYGEDRFDWILYASGRKNRIVVDSVFGESAAGEVGLEPGDLILSYGDSRVFNGRELRQATIEGRAGELVALEYERDGEARRVYVPRGPVGVQLHDTTLLPNDQG